jgi:hypothetical protein
VLLLRRTTVVSDPLCGLYFIVILLHSNDFLGCWVFILGSWNLLYFFVILAFSHCPPNYFIFYFSHMLLTNVVLMFGEHKIYFTIFRS